MVGSAIIQIWHAIWYAAAPCDTLKSSVLLPKFLFVINNILVFHLRRFFLRRAMHPEGPTDFSWTLVFLIWFSLLFGLALFVMLILGNVWVWSSDKCDNTSTPVRFMISLFYLWFCERCRNIMCTWCLTPVLCACTCDTGTHIVDASAVSNGEALCHTR